MPSKRILLLDGHLLTAHVWSTGHVKAEGEFSPDPVGLEAFAAYLKKHRSSIFYLLADVAEEGFQLEDLPYVQGGDRTALLQRRLSQYYYNTPLSAAISLGRARQGRRDEKLLFAALTRVETFTPWLDALREAEAILAGVYSVPLVLANCGSALSGENGPALLVTVARSGIRQTFFDQGQLHFSRLSQLATHGLDEIGRTMARDAAKIVQYLVAQRQIPRGTTLRTVILAHREQIPALQNFCQSTGELQFEFVDLAATAHKQRLKDVPAASSADNLFIHWLASRTPEQQFAPASERNFHKLWQIRFALTSIAWIAFAGCLLFAGKTAFNVRELGDKINAAETLTAADTRRYNRILEGLPKVSLTPDSLRALIGRLETLQQRSTPMEPLLRHLSLALNETPKIELVRLSWKISDRPGAGPKSGEGAKQAAPQANPAPAGSWTVVEIQAQLPLGLVTDQRAQIDLIEGFAARLRDPRTDVTILSRPFDIESDKPLRSASEKAEAQVSDVPKFVLRIARPL